MSKYRLSITAAVIQVQNVIEERSDMILVKPSSALGRIGDTSQVKPTLQQPSCRKSTAQEIHQETGQELWLSSGSTFRLELTGDVEIVADDGDDVVVADAQQHTITFHELVGRCYRQFTLVPKSLVGADKGIPKVAVIYRVAQ